jgi:hypothetical protein
MLEFLKMLRQSISRKQVPHGEAMDIYKSLAKSALLSFSFSSLTSFKTPYGVTKPSRYELALPNTAEQSPFFIDYRTLLAFIGSLFKFNLDEHLESLVLKLCTGARMIKGREFDLLYIPLLQGLVSILEEQQIPLSTPRYQQVFQTLLQAYLTNYVQNQPKKPTLQRNRVSCSCCDCAPLNRFLVSASQEVGRFRYALPRREHLLTQLAAAGSDCDDTIDRRGSPHTLVVTKTTKQYDKAKQDWDERMLTAENGIFAFDQTKLKILLADQYDDIISMRHACEASSGLQSAFPSTAFGKSQLPLSTSSFTTSVSSRPPLSAPSFTTSGQPQLPLSAPAFTAPGQSRLPLGPTSGNPRDELARLQAEIARAVETGTPGSSSVKPTTKASPPMSAFGYPYQNVSRPQIDIAGTATSGGSVSVSAGPTYPTQPAYTSWYSSNPVLPSFQSSSGLFRHAHAPPLTGIKRKAADVFDDDSDVIEVIDLTCDSD